MACWAETVVPEDYLVDPVHMKRYSVDPADPAFSCVGSMYATRQSPADGRAAGGSSSSCSHRPTQTSSGGSSSTGLRHQTSSPTRNGTYPEGNRSGNLISSYEQCVLLCWCHAGVLAHSQIPGKMNEGCLDWHPRRQCLLSLRRSNNLCKHKINLFIIKWNGECFLMLLLIM